MSHVRWGNNKMDGELLGGDSYSPAVYQTGDQGQGVAGASAVTIGQDICFDGAMTLGTCAGQVVGTDACIKENDHGTIYTVCNQALVQSDTRMSQLGDSGGPVYRLNSNLQPVAEGIISSGNDSGTQSSFTQLSDFTNALGLSVVSY